jgi:hypothetical protein
MAQLNNNDIDPMKTPLDRAENLWRDQLEAAIEIILPKRRDPITKKVHDMGLTLKELRDATRI